MRALTHNYPTDETRAAAANGRPHDTKPVQEQVGGTRGQPAEQTPSSSAAKPNDTMPPPAKMETPDIKVPAGAQAAGLAAK